MGGKKRVRSKKDLSFVQGIVYRCMDHLYCSIMGCERLTPDEEEAACRIMSLIEGAACFSRNPDETDCKDYFDDPDVKTGFDAMKAFMADLEQ